MVRLTMTAAMVSAIQLCDSCKSSSWPPTWEEFEPDVGEPALGKPISHAQVLAIYNQLRRLREENATEYTLDLNGLLKGSRVWTEPPKPKLEPTEEYKALMERLRAEREEQAYNRMLVSSSSQLAAPPPSLTAAQSFAQRFPNSPYEALFPDSQGTLPPRLSSSNAQNRLAPGQSESVVYDDASFATVNRQLALIGNVLVSIIATAVAIWWATWHWRSTGARLGISMGGSGLVGVAEIVVYLGYIQRLENAKTKERGKREVKKVTRTWVIEGRKGNIEKRTVGSSDTDVHDANSAVATGSWPELPENMRKRQTVKK